MADSIDDSSLVSGIIEGDEKHLKYFASYYGERLMMYLTKRGVSHYDAEEIVNESLYKVVRRIGLYNPMRGKFSSWVFKIAINTLKDRFKRSKIEEHIESLDERLEKGFQDSESLWEDPENSESNLKLLSKELLNNALKKLSERERAILEERSYGLTHKQISSIIGTTENAAKVAYCRALKKLRETAFELLEPMDNERAEKLRSFLIHEETYEK